MSRRVLSEIFNKLEGILIVLDSELSTALVATCESDKLDFKRAFDPGSVAEWLELIKDIVAFANSGGGIVTIGADDDGTPVQAALMNVLAIDPADVTNKIYKYTDRHFHNFEFRRCQKDGADICAVLVGPVEVPLVFTHPGTYAVDMAKQKTAFSAGTVYCRHGAKSEPGNSDDLRTFIEKRLEAIKRSWLDGIAKVVEAPSGTRIAVLPADMQETADANATPIRVVDDPTAPAYRAIPVDQTHPYRQKEVVQQVNVRLTGRAAINAHHIFCIRRVYNIDQEPTFCYTQRHATPKYSDEFVDWIVARFERNDDFFEDARRRFVQLRQGQLTQRLQANPGHEAVQTNRLGATSDSRGG